MLIIQTLVGSAEKAKASTLAAESPERVLITRTSPPLRKTITTAMKTWMNLQTLIKPTVDPRCDDGEETPDYDDDEENETLSSYIALDDVTF